MASLYNSGTIENRSFKIVIYFALMLKYNNFLAHEVELM